MLVRGKAHASIAFFGVSEVATNHRAKGLGPVLSLRPRLLTDNVADLLAM